MKILTNVVLGLALVGTAGVVLANANTNTSTAVNHAAVAALKTTTVKQALSLKDDSKVQLKGYVVKSLGDEKYQFRDATGSMTVEIDDELWQGKAISAKTPVTLVGEVDVDYKPMKRVEIDVDNIKF